MSITVTASGISSTNDGFMMSMVVLTNAVESGGNGSAVAASSSSPSDTWSPNGSNSYILGTYNYDNSATTPTALSNTHVDYTYTGGSNSECQTTSHYTGTVTSGTAIANFGYSAPSGRWVHATYEVKASGGSTPSVDGSTPAASGSPSNQGANSTSGASNVTITTNGTPPSAAVLVVLVAYDTSTGAPAQPTITDNSGLGLTWTMRQGKSASTQSGGAWIFTTSMPGSTTVSDSDTSGAETDAGEGVIVLGSDTSGPETDGAETIGVADTGSGATVTDGGEAVTATVADTDASNAAVDGGEAVLHEDFSLSRALPSPAWLTRFRRPYFHRSLPLPWALQGATDTDAEGPAVDGAEFVTIVQGPFRAATPSPSWQAAFWHTSRPVQPISIPGSTTAVTASISTPGFDGGSVLQVWVLDNATETGGAVDAEVLGNIAGTGVLTPNFTGSFVGWVVFNISGAVNVSADVVEANNTFDVNIPGTVMPVGAAGHYTGTVTAGSQLNYGLSSGTTLDNYILAACEVPPLNGNLPVALDPFTPPGVSDATTLSSLSTASFTIAPGQVLMAAYGTNNAVAASATFSITDPQHLAWHQQAIVNSADNFLVVVWTATVPTSALNDSDVSGPSTDFVSAAVYTGQVITPDASGPETDAGESIATTLSSADASGAASDAALPSVTVVPVTAGEDASGAGADGGEIIQIATDASGTGSDGAETVKVSSSDASGAAVDDVPVKDIAATQSDTETCHGTDAGELIVLSDATGESSGPELDAGEFLVREDYALARQAASPSFRARFSHRLRPVIHTETPSLFSVTDAVPDTCHGQDAEIDNPFPVDTPETSASADAGETVAVADRDVSAATDITFEFEFCHGTEFELSAFPADSDGSLAFDPELDLFTQFSSDASGQGEDRESVLKAVPIASSDASGAAADSQSVPSAALSAADASNAAVDNREFIPKDADAEGPAADFEEVLSATFADADFSLAFDVESRVFGPNNAVSDTDASGTANDAGYVLDVYAFQPLFRFSGGYFHLRGPGEVS